MAISIRRRAAHALRERELELEAVPDLPSAKPAAPARRGKRVTVRTVRLPFASVTASMRALPPSANLGETAYLARVPGESGAPLEAGLPIASCLPLPGTSAGKVWSTLFASYPEFSLLFTSPFDVDRALFSAACRFFASKSALFFIRTRGVTAHIL